MRVLMHPIFSLLGQIYKAPKVGLKLHLKSLQKKMRICIYVLARFTFLIFFLVASIAAPIFNFLTYCLPPQLKDLTSLQCHSLPHSPAMEMSLTNLTTLPSPTPFQLLQSAITVSSNIQQPTSPPNPWSPSKSWNYETQPF